ncbi:MAG: hypothetical protein Q8P70_00120 [bacterium]|nr:hypothetical protein [bacterium]
MNVAMEWYNVTMTELTGLWAGFLGFIPQLFGALVVFGIGLLIAAGVGKLVAVVLEKLRLNQAFEKGAWKNALERAEIKMDASAFLGGIVKWILVIVFLMAAVEILGMNEFAGLLHRVLAYLPNVVVAALIFVVAALISDMVEKLLRTAVEGAQMKSGHMVGVIVRWSIWIFAVLMILNQLWIGGEVPVIVTQGIVAFFAIAGGLAFGLGGKDTAAEIVQDFKKKIQA